MVEDFAQIPTAAAALTIEAKTLADTPGSMVEVVLNCSGSAQSMGWVKLQTAVDLVDSLVHCCSDEGHSFLVLIPEPSDWAGNLFTAYTVVVAHNFTDSMEVVAGDSLAVLVGCWA